MNIPFTNMARSFFASTGQHLGLLSDTARSYHFIGKRKAAILAEIERGVFGSFPVVMIVGVFTG
ncbi:MAG TPA: hypothetical protein VJC37_01415, partial [Planctomycetota bacterium]|nr:hypothetical protein [Planctomycetota bacterium]